jgi:DNA-binding transcriptional LysR family regulator
VPLRCLRATVNSQQSSAPASDDLELRFGLVDGGELGDDLPWRGLSHHLLQERRVVEDGIPHHTQRRGRTMKDLYRDRWLCAVAEDNDEVGESITLEQLAALPWAAYQRFYDAPVNRQLSLLGIEPQVQVSVDSFQLLPIMVTGTRRVAMIQALLADRLGLGPGSGIRLIDCPFDAIPVQEALWWHPVHTHDAGHLWLRETVAAVAARVAVLLAATGTVPSPATVRAVTGQRCACGVPDRPFKAGY